MSAIRSAMLPVPTLAAAELAVVQSAAAGRADQGLDAVGAIWIGALEPIEENFTDARSAASRGRSRRHRPPRRGRPSGSRGFRCR